MGVPPGVACNTNFRKWFPPSLFKCEYLQVWTEMSLKVIIKTSRDTFPHEFQSRIFSHLSCIRLSNMTRRLVIYEAWKITTQNERDPELYSVPHGPSN